LKDKYSDVGKDQGIDLEDNKDFVNMYEQNLDNLKKQYDVAMKKGKDSLRTLLFN